MSVRSAPRIIRSRLLVSGLINFETILGVDGFPVEYAPVRYPFNRVHGSVSGVGYNVAKALTVLGDEVRFLSMIGKDPAGVVAREALRRDGIDGALVLDLLDETPQSVILCNPDERRAINVDLKAIQETPYPVKLFESSIEGCRLAALCNINFSRPFLAIAQNRNIPIATDVHCISDLDDAYNADFMAAATILFMSGESLPCDPEEWVARLERQFTAEIVVIGLGAAGALLFERSSHRVTRLPIIQTRPIRNATGAGDALFSCFVHSFAAGDDSETALRKAMIFASWKLGGSGGADGFLTAEELRKI